MKLLRSNIDINTNSVNIKYIERNQTFNPINKLWFLHSSHWGLVMIQST